MPNSDKTTLNALAALVWAIDAALIARLNNWPQAATAGIATGLTIALTFDFLDRRPWPTDDQLYHVKLAMFVFGVFVLVPAFIAAINDF